MFGKMSGFWVSVVLIGASVAGSGCNGARPPAQRLPMELIGQHKRKPRTAPTTGSLMGVVLGVDGKPVDFALIAAVSVSEDPEGGKSPFLATAIDRGKFEISNMPPGNYGITVTGPEANAAVPPTPSPPPAAAGAPVATGTFAGVVTVTAGDPGPPMLLRLGATGTLLAGRVTDEAGQPIGGALVRAVRESAFEGDHFFAKTDENGKFTLSVPVADYFLVAQAEGKRPVRVALDRKQPPATLAVQLSPALVPPSRDDLLSWIASTGGSISSADVADTAELDHLRDIVGKARVVGLGDASYVGGESFKVRARMFRFLASNMGFSSLLLEATQSDVRPLDDYIQTGKGSLPEILRGLGYFSLDTQEATALFWWMRDYNRDWRHRTKLRVFGVDVQRTASAATGLAPFLAKADKVFLPTVETTLERLRVNDFGLELRKRPAEEQDKVAADLDAFAEQLRTKEKKYIGRTSAPTFARVKADVEALRWAVRVYRDEAQRGAAMADLARRAVDAAPKGTRFVLWAHDAFVSKRKEDGGTGALLAAAYKADYVAMGATFYSGWIRAWDFTTGPTTDRGTKLFRLAPAETGTLEGMLDLAATPIFFADVRKAKAPVADWLGASLSMRSVSTAFASERRARTRVVVRDAFDALLFVKKQTTVTVTETGRRLGRQEED